MCSWIRVGPSASGGSVRGMSGRVPRDGPYRSLPRADGHPSGRRCPRAARERRRSMLRAPGPAAGCGRASATSFGTTPGTSSGRSRRSSLDLDDHVAIRNWGSATMSAMLLIRLTGHLVVPQDRNHLGGRPRARPRGDGLVELGRTWTTRPSLVARDASAASSRPMTVKSLLERPVVLAAMQTATHPAHAYALVGAELCAMFPVRSRTTPK